MKWLIAALLAAAIALSSLALYKARRLEAAAKPRLHLIAALTR